MIPRDNPHRFVLTIEDGTMTWRLLCPENGSCAADEEAGTGECWAQSWVGNSLAEEVLHGTVMVEFPVDCQWSGDSLEAHIAGPASPPTEHVA